ncbi:hypothetical protein L873DRAFT_1793776 [Choiromyces venosus 120613-1]|uniref:Uncharacterized protein n=1 Tax=Choiromyces venosus 120613-1 TaxID=1336337 RepID=A0A3N4J872_9PEZI|nr:hypothetical protein L873DRAFT_1793776 [Choiromyces venosus 120613-1]
MADKLDPHHLVALMSYIFRTKQDGSSRRFDPTSINPEYGVTNKHETNIGTFPILDAIASISVFKDKSQVVAVALQLDSKEREIRLTIAENQEVEPRVVHHLGSVWGKLQALSNEFAAKGGSDKNEERSPDLPEYVALPLRMQRVEKWWSRLINFVKELAKRRGVALQGVESDLFDVVTGLYTVIQLLSRLHCDPKRGLTDAEWKVVYNGSMWVSKKAGIVLADRQHFGCEILAQELNGMPLLTPITSHMQSIRTTHRPLDLGHTDSRHEEPEYLGLDLVGVLRCAQTIYHTNFFASCVQVLHAGDMYINLCEGWRLGVRLIRILLHLANARPKDAFRLRRAIEKLTSPTRPVECLISFANSPRLRPILQYHMSIFTIPGQTRTVKLPGSQEQGEACLEVAAAKILPWQEGNAEQLAENFRENIRVCPAHRECALIQYLTTGHRDSWDHVPAFSYVGVSKLSCSACRIWLETFNEVGQWKFYTRGSHGKWYWPWRIPTVEESLGEVMAGESSGEVAPEKSLGETMAGKISREYIKYLEERNLYRSGTDSTVASLSGGKRHLSNDEMESVRSDLEEETQQFGSTMERQLEFMADN